MRSVLHYTSAYVIILYMRKGQQKQGRMASRLFRSSEHCLLVCRAFVSGTMAQCTECAALQQHIDRLEQEKRDLLQQLQHIVRDQRQRLEWMQQIDDMLDQNQLFIKQLQPINDTPESSMTDSSNESSMSADVSSVQYGPPKEFPIALIQQLQLFADQAMALARTVTANHPKFVTHARTAAIAARWQKVYSGFRELSAEIDTVASMEDLPDSEDHFGTPPRLSPILHTLPSTGTSNPAVVSRWTGKPTKAVFTDDAFYDRDLRQVDAGPDPQIEAAIELGWHPPKPDSPTQT